MTPLTHGYIFKMEHPSFAARENREWETEGVFKSVSKIVKMSNGYDIDWLNEEKNNQDEPPF
jgi:hypothetical protein